MSWLGTGLSQITGQISNFTKEVLTEGTEEVDDHATELRVAKAKFTDLEGQHYSARVELERTKHINEELSEHLKSSELQIKAISSDYREKLNQREEEIKRLKQQHHEMLEAQSKLAVAGNTSSSPGSTIRPASVPNLHAFGGDEHDFDDVVSGQHQINRLQAEVDRLSAECRHWKKIASAQKPNSESLSLDGAISEHCPGDFHGQIKDLQQQLAKEIDNHQDELSALQSLHNQKLNSLSRKQAEEKKRYEEKIDEFERHNTEEGALKEVRMAQNQLVAENEAMASRLQELLQENELLRSRTSVAGNESVVEGDANKGWNIGLPSSTPRHMSRPALEGAAAFELSFSEISEKNKAPYEQVQALQSQVVAYQHEISQFDIERSDWTMEKEALESVLMKLRTELKTKEEEIAVIQAEQGLKEIAKQQEGKIGIENLADQAQQKPEFSTSEIDIEELSYQVELLTKGNSILEKERNALHEEKGKLELDVQELQKKINDLEPYQLQVDQSEISNIKLAAEVEEKENEIIKLKNLLKKQQEQVNSLVTQTEEMSESLIEKEAEIAELEESLESASEQAENVNKNTRKPSEEDVDDEIKKMRVELQSRLEQIQQLRAKEKDLEELLANSKAREASYMELVEEKKALEVSLEELDAQHEEAITAVIQSKEKLDKANEELTQRIKVMEKQLPEKSEANSTVNDEKIRTLEADLHIAQEKVRKMEQDIATRNSHMTELEEKVERSALALNDLHMDKKELEGEVTGLRQQVHELSSKVVDISSEKSKLENSYTELKGQLHKTHEKLQAESTKTQINSGLQSDFLRLREELDLSQQKNSEHNIRVASLEQEIVTLQEKLATTSQDYSNISLSAADAEHSYKYRIEELCKTHKIEIESLSGELSELKSVKMKLQRELSTAEDRFKEQTKQYENYILEIRNSKELNASLQEDEHQRILKEKHEKELKCFELEASLSQLRSEVEDTKNQLQNALDESQETAALLNDKETEIGALQAQVQAYQEYLEERAVDGSTLQTVKPALTEDANGQKLQEEKIHQLEVDVSEKLSQIEDYEEELAVLQHELHEQKQQRASDVEKLKTALKQLSEEQDRVLKLEASLATKEVELRGALDESESLKSVLEESQKLPQEELIQNGHVYENQLNDDQINNKEIITSDEDYQTLRNVIHQKDEVISELRKNNSSLLKMLEERSMTMHGNKSLLDIHRLNNENKTFKMEKEQMLSVLNEKTRECSNLKSEVHKLMNVISAEKTALAKLQKDNQELLQRRSEPVTDEPNSDMTREAVKNLSMVIRDKDLIIESLNQKIKTLQQVIQLDSGGAELSAVFQEKDNLEKQLEMYQKDREQMILAINQKHQEAVTYHTEVSRLTVLLTQNTDKQEVLEREFTNLKGQYEDKQQTLLKLQNELLNHKQKFDEVDERYKEILHRQAQQVQEQVQTPNLVTSPRTLESRSSAGASLPEASKVQSDNESSSHIAHMNQILAQKKDEINELKEQLRELNISLQERERAISEHKRNLQVKDQILKDKESVIEKRNSSVSEANSRVRESHEHLRTKDLELSSLRKQKDNLSFQIRGLQTELTDIKQERDKMVERAEGVMSERTQLAEANARLSAAIGERDLELNAMREKVATLTAAVSLVGAEKGEVEQMLADTEAMQKAAQVLQGERDQAYSSLQAVQADNTTMKQQMMHLAEREQKLQRELDRLRSHLLTIEEGYTTEALAAEEREKELRNRLAAAEENAMNSSNAVQSYSVEAGRQVESLQKQLHEIAEQRDRALMDLTEARDRASQYAASLTNLQMVLEQFQREREEHLVMETERYQHHLAERDKQVKELQVQNRDLTAHLEEANSTLEAAHRLSEQLDRKEEQLMALKEEVVLREDMLKKSEIDIAHLKASNEGKVDTIILKNIVLGYFHSPTNKRGEVLLLLGKVLNFTKNEMQEVGADSGSGGWLTGIFKRTVGSVASTPPTTPKRAQSFFMDQSFSEMFVKFLERESSPQPTMRLPAEAMAREKQEKQQQRNKPAFNPFAAPAHTINPTTRGLPRSEESSHLLMKPMAATLPMLTPVVTTMSADGGAEIGQPSFVPQPSGRVSGNSSGRSTPASTSAILKDVLQQ